MKRTLLAVLLVGTALVGWAPAQEAEEDGPGVARLSVINGDVSIRRGDSGDWISAATNAPIVVTDSVLAGAASRAEVQLDSYNMVRLAPETEVRFSELEYQRFQVQVARGTVTLSVLENNEANVDLNTPNISVRPIEKGRYRVAVRPDGTTEVTVRAGRVEVFSPSGVEELGQGRTMIVRGSASEPEFQLAAAIEKDSWDRWNEQRDKELRRGASGYQYASRDIAGVEDLDGYGSWVYVAPYGWVWSPRVASGWAPYRHGRWSWVDYYGWSWVSYDPWGWAPYHYGRWFDQPGYGWCWYPGAYRSRHYWSPGLVAFFGWGSGSGFHVGFGFGFGHVGWVPLAPYERYHRWYGRGYYHGYRNGNYIDNSVNIVNNVNVTNIYRNARVNNGITAVEGRNFGNRSVQNTFRGDRNSLRQASLVRGQVPVVPQRASLNYSDRQVRAENLPARSTRQSFATRRTATSRGEPVPFAQQQRGVQEASRSIFSRQNQRSASSANPSANSATRAGQSTSRVTNAQRSGTSRATTGTDSSTRSGWRTFGEPARSTGSAATRAGRSGTAATRSATPPSDAGSTGSRTPSGWRRFGEPTRSSASGTATRGTQPRSTGSSAPGGRSSSADRSSGWSSFGDRGATSGSSTRSSQPSGASRTNSGRSGSFGVNPPIVRDRSTTGSRSSGASRTYSPPSRSGSSDRANRAPSRTYSPPPRSNPSYSSPSNSRSSGRTYSPPARSNPSYSPPARSSAPSRSSGPSYSSPSRSSSPSRGGYSAPSRSSGGTSSGSMGGGRSSAGGGGGRSSGGGGRSGRSR